MKTVIAIILVLGIVFVHSLPPRATAAGPRREAGTTCARYSIPDAVLAEGLTFAGEVIPLQRRDVRSRIEHELNFLMMDARSVLTLWLVEKGRYQWIFEDIFSKTGIPRDFVLLAPILSGLSARSHSKLKGAGWWALDKPCSAAEGVPMLKTSWTDDRLDIDLSTRCFATRIKSIRKKLKTRSWLTAAAAYVTSTGSIENLGKKWHTLYFWNLPLPDTAEQFIVRWIAFGIIDANRPHFGLKIKEAPPWTYDNVTGIVLNRDLPVSVIARMTRTPPRRIMQFNPRLKPSKPVLPAKFRGKRIRHFLAVPKGKGWTLVHKLAAKGYLRKKPRR